MGLPDAARQCLPNSRGPIRQRNQCPDMPASAPGLLQELLQKEPRGAVIRRDVCCAAQNGERPGRVHEPESGADPATVLKTADEVFQRVPACSRPLRRELPSSGSPLAFALVDPVCPAFACIWQQIWQQIGHRVGVATAETAATTGDVHAHQLAEPPMKPRCGPRIRYLLSQHSQARTPSQRRHRSVDWLEASRGGPEVIRRRVCRAPPGPRSLSNGG